MIRDKAEISKQLSEFFQEMVNLANADETISKDEQNILDRIKIGIKELELQLVQVLESDLDEEDFEDLEQQILQDIIKNVEAVAMADQVITDEERVLIAKLKEFAEGGIQNS